MTEESFLWVGTLKEKQILPFDCKEQNISLGLKWKRWKRSFEIFLSAVAITDDTRKKNMLLHYAGPDVQDIYFSLPVSEDTTSIDQYTITMNALDTYFAPKVKTLYERYVFRCLKQQPGETVEEYIIKLTEQAKNCNFTNLEEQIRDQVIEKCYSSKLRKKIFDEGELKLSAVREIAKCYEASESQLDTRCDANAIQSEGSGRIDEEANDMIINDDETNVNDNNSSVGIRLPGLCYEKKNSEHIPSIREVDLTGESYIFKNESIDIKQSPEHIYEESSTIEDLSEGEADNDSRMTISDDSDSPVDSMVRDDVDGTISSEAKAIKTVIGDKEKNLNSTTLNTRNLSYTITDYLRSSVELSKRRSSNRDRKYFCLFCHKEVSKFSRHLERRHKSEPEVKAFSSMSRGSLARRRIIDGLRRKGNFFAPRNKKIKLVKSSSKPISTMNILPCVYCNGFYRKNTLFRHQRKCPMRPNPQGEHKKTKVASDAQTLLAFQGIKLEFVKKLDLQDWMLDMKVDEVSFTVKSEPLILCFASFYAKKHNEKHLRNVIKNKMRQLGRLWNEMRNRVQEENFYDALKPENFQYFIESTKKICGYNDETKKYDTSTTLAMNMAANLKLLCDYALVVTKSNNDTFTANKNIIKKTNELETLRNMVLTKWKTEMGFKTYLEPKISLMCLTDYLHKFYKFVKEKADNSLKMLEKEEHEEAFNELQKCCFTLLQITNEVKLEDIQVDSYTERQQDLTKELTSEPEKIILNNYHKFVIDGKNQKPITVLVSAEIQKYIEQSISKYRKQFIPAYNHNLFALSTASGFDGLMTLQNLTDECRVDFPQVLMIGKLRKQIATISKILCLAKSKRQQLWNYIGPAVSTHQNISGISDEIYQTAELARIILINKAGNTTSSNEEPVTCMEAEIDQSNSSMEINLKSYSNEENGASRHRSFHPKIRWTEEQKKATMTYFSAYIVKRKLPNESEIMAFKSEYSCMDNKSWPQIKAFISNDYQRKKRLKILN